MTELAPLRATCHLAIAFEIGSGIDLDACDRHLERATRQRAGSGRRVPSNFEYRPPPLRIGIELVGLALPGLTPHHGEIVLFDFGAASVSYQFTVSGPLGHLAAVSDSLQGNSSLENDARQRLIALMPTLGTAISKPRMAELVEDYLTVVIDPASVGCEPSNLIADRATELAQILRGAGQALSADEIGEALAERLSFSTADLTLVDWNAAIIIDPEPDEARVLMEFANVQLLELRHLDGQLDRALERAYQTLAATEKKVVARLRPPTGALQLLSELQMDAAVLFERVSSAVKLVGDQFLGRLYLSLSRRFHFEAWDRAISRKLDVLDGIYQKVGDRVTARRLEALEWIVIILIAIELVVGLIH